MKKKTVTRFFRSTAAVILSAVMICSASAGPAVYGAECFGPNVAEDTADLTSDPERESIEKPVRPANTAASGVVIDGITGKIIYSKYPRVRRDPLSTTKLLTCLVALEHLELQDIVKVTKSAAATGGSTADLRAGERVSVKDLIYACMLPSGNDAAVALACGVSGNTSDFAELMNEKAVELGCQNSSFSNPHGWKAKRHYSTAYDMALITKAAMENSVIRKACGTEIYRMAATNKHKARKIATTNYLVAKKKYPNSGVYASKTGTWEYDNASLASACRRNGRITYAVVMEDTTGGRYTTTNKILNYSYKKLKWMAERE